MNQNESDIAFKIEEKVIPAHKSILMKKSRYFANVLNSGMAESTQDVIEVKDCEYEIFKEYLRWIYQDTMDFSGDINRAMKLYTLADKYTQADLIDKCLNFLIFKISKDNVYAILDFAHQENLPQIKNWCLKFFESNPKIKNITGLLNYLDNQEDPCFKENNERLIEKACDIIIKKLLTVFEKDKEKMKLSENVEIDEINGFKESVFRFVQENFEIIMASEISEGFSKSFLRDLTVFQGKLIKNIKKRMEPIKDGSNEENPKLKKTKK